jgi:precorrin-2/cobalt-factor-2 C20-methyltransferase
MTASGIAYGIGVGPGDPELITLKALRVLRRVSVVAYPAPPEGPSLARRIAAPHLIPAQVEIAMRMPLDVRQFPSPTAYDKAARAIGAELKQGRDVAILCEGDPFLYGSFQYLYARLAKKWPVKVIPGVSSIMAAAAMAGWPLAAKSDTLTVLPATLPAEELSARLSHCDSAAILKLGRHFEKARVALRTLGLEKHSLYVERASMENARALPLAEVTAESVPYFSLILMRRPGASAS